MTRIVVDPATLSKLAAIGSTAELCDAEGNIVGFFHAATADMYRTHVPDVSLEELERIANEPGGRSLAEIMRDLERMGK